MPEPFKNFFNPTMINQMAGHLQKQNSAFDSQRFVDLATEGLDALELKQRSNHILAALEQTLPREFVDAASLMVDALHPEDGVDLSGQTMDNHGIRGWAVMPMADYVGRHGFDHFDFSMNALKEMTKRSSSEFAVRPFIAHDQERAMRHVERWATDPSYHVRRLASEGSRPRLPWGMRLNAFIEDPSPLLPVLERLKDDPEEYVRRSVANNLNDIAKDHPDLVASIAGKWLDSAPSRDRQRLVRHACRTLIKQGHKATMEAFGYGEPLVSLRTLILDVDKIRVGEAVTINAQLRSESEHTQELVVDYLVYHQRANGTTSPKVFKWKTVTLPPRDTIGLEKKHAMRPVTTRTYYPGTHAIEIQVNGQSLGRCEFDLSV